MKKITAFILSLIMLLSAVPQAMAVAIPSASDEEAEAAKNLFQYLDPQNQNTCDVYNAYKAGDWHNALVLYRNYLVDKLRKIDVGTTGWHGANIADTYIDMAKVLVGEMTAEDFSKKYNGREYLDYVGWSGSPYEAEDIRWLDSMQASSGTQEVGIGFESNFRFLNKLASGYYFSKEQIYIDKYLQVAKDFYQRHRVIGDQWLADNPDKAEEAKKTYPQMFWQTTGAGAAGSKLWCSARATDVLKNLGYFSKMLPTVEKEEFPEWNDIGDPVNTTLLPESYDMIDPVAIAVIVYHMLTDDMELLFSYFTGGGIVNQYADGVYTTARIMDTFEEFTILEQYETYVEKALSELVDDVMNIDGGVLEQSFNYNVGTVGGFEAVTNWLSYHGDAIPSWGVNFANAVKMWNRLYESMHSTVGEPAMIGNNTDYNFPAIWKDEAAYEKTKAEVQDKWNERINYNSVYFPYSGYGSIRSGWDLLEDNSMLFYNNNRRSSGHVSVISNAVWVTAYGRPMIMSGGIPGYGANYEGRENIEKIRNGYFGEDKTNKGSTVMVNGHSQSNTNSDGKVIIKPASEPHDSRWLEGKRFTYGEGTWSGGYSGIEAIHDRSFIYLQSAKLWIVTDTMTNKNTNGNYYEQIWRYMSNCNTPTSTGYYETQVEADSEERLIKTTDNEGPNIWITNFTPQDIEYEKYYGYAENGVYRGWSGANGDTPNPGVDMIVKWEDNPGDITQVSCVLDPTKDSSIPYSTKQDLSDKEQNITAYKYITDDNIEIKYFSSPEQRNFEADGIAISAKLLITMKNGDDIGGIALDASALSYNGNDVELPYSSFEFEIEDGELKILSEIAVPTGFSWVEGADGYYPRYNSIAAESAKAIIDGINESANSLSIIHYGFSDMLIKYFEHVESGIKQNIELTALFPRDDYVEDYINAVVRFVSKIYSMAEYYDKHEFLEKCDNVVDMIAADIYEYALKEKDNIMILNASVSALEEIGGSAQKYSDMLEELKK